MVTLQTNARMINKNLLLELVTGAQSVAHFDASVARFRGKTVAADRRRSIFQGEE